MSITYTPNQQSVITAPTANILVSAAAGSGKTSVLVERIMRMITDPVNPVDIDRILVVTFTIEAATQMKDRIRSALDARLSAEPDNERLIRESERLQFAQITTIDGFCRGAVQRYFHLLNIDPSFRTMDEAETGLLWSRAIEETYERFLTEGTQEFFDMLDRYSGSENEEGFYKTVKDLKLFADSAPFPEEWISKAAEDVAKIDSAKSLIESEAFASDVTHWKCLLRSDERLLTKFLQLCNDPDGPEVYISTIEEDLSEIRNLLATETPEAFQKAASAWIPGSFKPCRNPKNEQKKNLVSGMRNDRKKAWTVICETCADDTVSRYASEIQSSAGAIRTLCHFTKEASRHFRELMDEENAYDFSTIAHLTLSLFVTQKDGELVYTEAAKQYRSTFHEIMIDEYQDSNMVQEMFLNAVSGISEGHPNVFTVGDIKQSIYLFRMACPDLFAGKYNTYSDDPESPYRRILLNENFRSRKQVVDGVNDIFRKIMIKDLGGVDYDRSAELIYGAKYPYAYTEEEGRNEYLLVKCEETEDKNEAVYKSIIDRILTLTDPVKGLYVSVKDRPARIARFGDIVVLAKTKTKGIPELLAAFKKAGIPSYLADAKGYFDAPEVRNVLHFLKILDNPLADIPFAGVLKSPVCGFSFEELALIRIWEKERRNDGNVGYLYDTLRAICDAEYLSSRFAEVRRKAETFLSLYDELREKRICLTVSELLGEIYRLTGYVSMVSVTEGGSEKERNLLTLIEKAKEFEKGVFTGLSDFVRYIDDMIRYDVNPEAGFLDTSDSVRVMSIHKSKGLEFPIVFLIDCERDTYYSGENPVMLFHSGLGIGPTAFFPEERRMTDTYLKQAVARRRHRDEVGEAIRLLYVAMTRAKEKLILTGYMKAARFGKMLTNLTPPDEPMEYSDIEHAANYQELILPCILSGIPKEERDRIQPIGKDIWAGFSEVHTANWIIKTVSDETLETAKLKRTAPAGIAKNEEPVSEVMREFFSYRYPHQNGGAPVKLSVSALKKSRMEETDIVQDHPDAHIEHEPEKLPPVPKFISPAETSEDMRGAMRGTWYHRILELHDYGREGTATDWKSEVTEMVNGGFVPKETLTAIDFNKLGNFCRSDIGQRMKQAALRGTLKREQAFVMGVPADTIQAEYPASETVLIQGIIDAFFEEEDGIVLVDYKTDRVGIEDGEEVLKSRYGIQLRYYADAITRGTGKKVKECVIYSFALQKSVLL